MFYIFDANTEEWGDGYGNITDLEGHLSYLRSNPLGTHESWDIVYSDDIEEARKEAKNYGRDCYIVDGYDFEIIKTIKTEKPEILRKTVKIFKWKSKRPYKKIEEYLFYHADEEIVKKEIKSDSDFDIENDEYFVLKISKKLTLEELENGNIVKMEDLRRYLILFLRSVNVEYKYKELENKFYNNRNPNSGAIHSLANFLNIYINIYNYGDKLMLFNENLKSTILCKSEVYREISGFLQIILKEFGSQLVLLRY